MGNFGVSEILIVLGLVFLLFGRGRLPGMGRKASDRVRKAKDAVSEAKDEFALGLRADDDAATSTQETPSAPPPTPGRPSLLARWRRRGR